MMEETKPWLRGIIDNIKASELIRVTSLENRNRIRLILLDTALEIAFKHYLEYELQQPIKVDKKTNREDLHKMVKKHSEFEDDIWKKIKYFYDIRCDLYHENAGKTLMDSDINDFYKVVLYIMSSLFNANLSLFEGNPRDLIAKGKEEVYVPINDLSPIDRIVFVVGGNKVTSTTDIKNCMVKMGIKTVMKPSKVGMYMKQKSYKHLFHNSNGTIELTDEGFQKYYKLQEDYKNNGK